MPCAIALLLTLLACPPKSKDSAPEDSAPPADGDGDGYAAQDQGGEDCDDQDATTHPGADELCDGLDNDCDGEVDEDPIDGQTWYADSDGDGFGDDESATTACDAPSGHVSAAGDCDDSDAAIHPEATEICNELDDDCDGAIDDEDDDLDASTTTEWQRDADGDGYGYASDVRSACNQPSGYIPVGEEDCDDGDAAIHPGASEDCNDGRDEDCDGLLDCEDGDCALDQICTGETDCGDGDDNDEDSYADCQDPDCWSETCHPDGVFARVREGYGALEVMSFGHLWKECLGKNTPYYGAMDIDSTCEMQWVAGTVWAAPSGATTWQTCNWSYWDGQLRRHVDIIRSPWVGGTWSSADYSRRGFRVDTGCDVDSSWFLPSKLEIGTGTAHTASGAVWLRGPGWMRRSTVTDESEDDGKGCIEYEYYLHQTWSFDHLTTGSTIYAATP